VTEERSGVVSLRWLGRFLFIMLAIVAERGESQRCLNRQRAGVRCCIPQERPIPIFGKPDLEMRDSILNSIRIEQ
jgi:hypothetical protein